HQHHHADAGNLHLSGLVRVPGHAEPQRKSLSLNEKRSVAMADPTSPEITSVLTEGRVFPPPPEFSRRAHIKSIEQYRELATQAERDPEGYWGARGKEEIFWKAPFQKVLEWKPPFAKWYLGGTTNLSYNCLDRHLASHGDKTALIFEGEPGDQRRL